MTGPPYPRPPRAGDNAIGKFIIGHSPIGSLPSFDFWVAVISQYANSPIMTQLMSNFSQYLDPTAQLDAFFDKVWNINTAIGHGLDIWGSIVGVSRSVKLPNAARYFGFHEAAADTFGESSFYAGQQLATGFALLDAPFKVLIFAKALSNISDGSIASINQLLLNLFPHRGNAYVIDGLDMTMEYRFNFALSDVELAIVQSSGVLPKPCGVSAKVHQL